jgi:hypothetical protein
LLTLLQDLRYSARTLVHTPAFTAALLATVALGIGSYATIAAFTAGLEQDLVGGVEADYALSRLVALLSWTVGLVFVTAAANIAGLLLSRANRRTHETAARMALGATRGRLAVHLLADSLAAALAGGAIGALVAYWTVTAFPALLYSEDAERLRISGMAATIVKATAIYTVTMLASALAPISQLHRASPMAVLRRSGDGATTAAGTVRSLLVMAQMLVCVVLVIGTGVLFQGFRAAVRTVRAQQIGQPVVALLQARGGFGRPDLGREYFAAAERAVSRLPGVTGVAWANTLPGARASTIDVRFEAARAGLREVIVDTLTPAASYLLAGLRVRPGRMFGGVDGANTCPVTLVNEAAAHEYFGDDALGRAIVDAAGRRVDVIGVVRESDVKTPLFYFYERQWPGWAADEVIGRRLRTPAVTPRFARAAGEINMTIASPRYFDTLGGAVVAGTDTRRASAGDCDVALVNREAADRWFGGRAIGGAIVDSEGRRAEIVGVVESPVLRVIERSAAPAVYFPATQRYVPSMILIAQADQATPALVAQIEQQLRGVDGAARDPQVMTLEERLVRTALGPERIAIVLVSVCAMLALGIAAIGVYGVLADAVRQRQREIALRLALGAPARHIVGGVLRDGVRLAVWGGGLGIAISWIGIRVLHHADDQFGRLPMWMWIAGPALLLAVVVVASVVPARWALAVNPLSVTRDS